MPLLVSPAARFPLAWAVRVVPAFVCRKRGASRRVSPFLVLHHVFVPFPKMAQLVGHQPALVPGQHQDLLPWPSYLAGHPSHTESQKAAALKTSTLSGDLFPRW